MSPCTLEQKEPVIYLEKIKSVKNPQEIPPLAEGRGSTGQQETISGIIYTSDSVQAKAVELSEG